ncbi:MAG: 50S ribosomal protein L23 [Deltaproteobacteria bacterium]|jgi:large subunit ribosomal protein L23|nr:50S ribosomal protein L23 [Deltaproteobacteria bacterium]
MKPPSQIILRPLNTEKCLKWRESYNKFSFEVAITANKVEIRHAVEQLFQIPNKVLDVRTVIMPGKFRRRRRNQGGYTSDWKKAIVTLVKGQGLPIFEEA